MLLQPLSTGLSVRAQQCQHSMVEDGRKGRTFHSCPEALEHGSGLDPLLQSRYQITAGFLAGGLVSINRRV